MSVFMLDSYCLGAKNAFFMERDLAEAEWMLESLMAVAPAVAVEPGYARNLLHELVAWSRRLGIEPHKDYAEAEALFGDISTEGQENEIEFGREGRPMLVAGPQDTPAQLRRWRDRLALTLGEDGFEYIDLDDEAEPDGEPDEDAEPLDPAECEARAGLYDADREPEAEAWLALDEDERLMRIEAYHRLAHIEVSDGPRHAVFHLIVENQIALGDEAPIRRVAARLVSEGLERHEAVHAIASLNTEQVYRAAAADDDPEISRAAYLAALEELTAESWRRHLAEMEEDAAAATLYDSI
jgi:hypothetical protein